MHRRRDWGSLGEGATLTSTEKLEIITLGVRIVGHRAPIVAGVSALSTREAVDFAKAAAERGSHGLMVLPPYVYSSDWREMKAHVSRHLWRNEPVVHALQQSVGLRDRFPARAHRRAGGGASESARREGVERDARRVTAIRALFTIA